MRTRYPYRFGRSPSLVEPTSWQGLLHTRRHLSQLLHTDMKGMQLQQQLLCLPREGAVAAPKHDAAATYIDARDAVAAAANASIRGDGCSCWCKKGMQKGERLGAR